MGTIVEKDVVIVSRMKFFLIIPLVVAVVLVAFAFKSISGPSLDEWAEKAPLEKVTVHPGQVVTDLIRERVPSVVRANGDMTYAISAIGKRQGKELGHVDAWEQIELPIPYENWAK